MDKSAIFDAFVGAVADAVVERMNGRAPRPDIKRAHESVRRTGRGFKLDVEKVQAIRALKAQGFTESEIAAQFNITAPMVNHIVHRRAWRDVP